MPDRADAAAREARDRHFDHAARQYARVREWGGVALAAILLAVALRSFAYEPYNIPSASMLPGLRSGDYLFVAKFPYGFSRFSLPLGLSVFEGRLFERMPERGDVVVFKSPRDNRTEVIKRVIGLPGDRVRMVDGTVELNGVGLSKRPAGGRGFIETLPGGRSYAVLDARAHAPRDDTRLIVVPPGRYLMLGDNRDDSADSRLTVADGGVGLVPAANLLGRAERIFFSVDGSARLADPATWPGAIRWSRIGAKL